MKMNKALITFLLFLNFSSLYSQKASELIDIVHKLPTISYGELPFLIYDQDKNGSVVEHRFYGGDSIAISKFYQLYISSLHVSDSLCYVINSKDEKVYLSKKDIKKPEGKAICNTQYFLNEDPLGDDYYIEMCQYVYPVAKAIVFDKFYIMYFWTATMSNLIEYNAIVVDNRGQLLSSLLLNSIMVSPPYYPYNSIKNKIRDIDYSKVITTFLPNNIILMKYPYNMTGGGAYSIITIDSSGRFNTCKIWTEQGEIDYKLTNGEKFKNYIRIDEDGNKTNSLICFEVEDKDGYSNIRRDSNVKSEIIRTINDGDIVFGTLVQNGWCKIDFIVDESGNVVEGGYIHTSRLKKLSNDENEFIKF